MPTMRILLAQCAFLLLFAPTAGAMVLDLPTAVRLALEQNLQLRAEEDNARAAEALVRQGYGLYDPRLQAGLAFGESADRRLADPALQTTSVLVTEYRRFDLGVVQVLPTGAELSVGINGRHDRLDMVQVARPYSSELGFSLAQPLLQGFGRTITEQQILFAVKDREAALEDLRLRAMQILAQVRNTYFEALAFRDNLAYRQSSVGLAQRVLEENRARVRAGVLPPVETLEAEVGLKLREREVLDARRALQDSLDRLALLLNIREEIVLAEEPISQPAIIADEERGIGVALEKRPDVLRRLREIERLELQQQMAADRVRPALNLVGRYAHRGFGEDAMDSLEELPSRDLRAWEVGLNFSYPIGNRQARNEELRSRLALRSGRTLLVQLQEETRREIRAALRLLETSSAMIEVASLGTDLAQERLNSLLKRREVGLATTRDVLQGEEDLAAARTQHIAALAEYNQAHTEYLRATGQLLEFEGVRFTGRLDPRSEQPLLLLDRP
jgi:outer membrane protein